VVNRQTHVANSRLGVNSAGAVFVAWVDDHTGNREAYLRVFENGAWHDLGGSSVGNGVSATPEESRLGGLAFDAEGRPLIAWTDRSATVYLKRWTGSAWEPMGLSTQGSGISDGGGVWWPALTSDSAGRPVVAWEATGNGGSSIYLKRWSGTAWEEVSGSASGYGVSGAPAEARLVALAGGMGNTLHLSWQLDADSLSSGIRYAFFDGQAWSALTDPSRNVSPPGQNASRPGLVLDGSSRPVMVWEATRPSGSAVYLARWDGTGWRGFGGSDAADGVSMGQSSASNAGVTIGSQGELIVVWNTNEVNDVNVYLKQWAGGAWSGLAGSSAPGGISRGTLPAQYPSVQAAGSKVYVVWEQSLPDGFSTVYLKELSLDR
jgi:hypothetical protein